MRNSISNWKKMYFRRSAFQEDTWFLQKPKLYPTQHRKHTMRKNQIMTMSLNLKLPISINLKLSTWTLFDYYRNSRGQHKRNQYNVQKEMNRKLFQLKFKPVQMTSPEKKIELRNSSVEVERKTSLKHNLTPFYPSLLHTSLKTINYFDVCISFLNCNFSLFSFFFVVCVYIILVWYPSAALGLYSLYSILFT